MNGEYLTSVCLVFTTSHCLGEVCQQGHPACIAQYSLDSSNSEHSLGLHQCIVYLAILCQSVAIKLVTSATYLLDGLTGNKKTAQERAD